MVQKRALSKNYYPGVYDASVGAQVASGETYEEAARREAFEELGVELGDLIEITKYKSFSERQREIRTLFIAQHEGPFVVDEQEVERVEFVSIKDLEDRIILDKDRFTAGFLISLKNYIKHKSYTNAGKQD